jgi:DNA-binding NtrC family response regulator
MGLDGFPEASTQGYAVLHGTSRGNRIFTHKRNNAASAPAGIRTPIYAALKPLIPGEFMSRILVIDDQADVRAMIGIVLRVHHFEIVEADSVAAGMKAFEDSSFDLAIVDIFLQNTNGFDLIKMMRERVANLPIVAISGMTTLDFLSSSPEFSDVVCLQKPFRPNDLVRAIEAARASSRQRVAAAR